MQLRAVLIRSAIRNVQLHAWVPRKLSLASACRRVAAKFRRGDHRPSEDYLRYERNADDSGQARLMREEAAGEAMRDFGVGGGT